MRNTGSLCVAVGVLWMGLVSCSTESGGDRRAESTGDVLRLGPFRQGSFIPDEKPLKPLKETDLREVALSLPIWEGGWEKWEKWVYEYSKAGTGVDEWTNPADGAQHAVTVRRMRNSPAGGLRVEVDHPSLKIFAPGGGIYHPWVAVLERREGGWFVESAGKKGGVVGAADR